MGETRGSLNSVEQPAKATSVYGLEEARTPVSQKVAGAMQLKAVFSHFELMHLSLLQAGELASLSERDLSSVDVDSVFAAALQATGSEAMPAGAPTGGTHSPCPWTASPGGGEQGGLPTLPMCLPLGCLLSHKTLTHISAPCIPIVHC